MTPVEVAYAAMKQKHGAQTWPEFDVPGGERANPNQ